MSGRKYSFQTGEVATLTVLDYVLFALTLLISVAIGVVFAIKDRKKMDTKTFLLGGRSMSVLPVSMSLLASFMSALTLLGTPTEMYNYNTMFAWMTVSFIFAIAGAAHIFIPIFYNLGLTTAFEYLELRFNKAVRVAGSLVYCIFMLVYMAFVLYAPSLALSAVTGVNLFALIASVGVACVLYTTIGGIKAVLWTDTFQVLVIFSGLLAVLIQGSIELGGFQRAWDIAAAHNRVQFTEINPDPATRHTVWSVFIGGIFFWVVIYGTNQAQVQRAVSCPSLKKAQIALWANLPGLMLIIILCCMIGILMFAFYHTCDPKAFKLITNNDQLLPLFVLDILGHVRGLPGVFTSCLFSGSLSTISSGLNSLAAVVLTDFIRPFCCGDISEYRATIVSKLLIVVFGVICMGLAFAGQFMGSVMQASYAITSVLSGPLFGLFVLGILFPWSNAKGALCGLACSLGLVGWIAIGATIVKPKHNPLSPVYTYGCNWTAINITYTPTVTMVDPESTSFLTYRLYTLSYLWYTPVATLTMVVVGLLVSFLTGYTRPSSLDSRLICPLVGKICCCLSEKAKKPLRMGAEPHEEYNFPASSDIEKSKSQQNNGDPINPSTFEEKNRLGQDNPVYAPEQDDAVTAF